MIYRTLQVRCVTVLFNAPVLASRLASPSPTVELAILPMHVCMYLEREKRRINLINKKRMFGYRRVCWPNMMYLDEKR